jgi:organic radical activating enzyme
MSLLKKARVIVTLKCNRNCGNCCNKEEVFKQHKVLTNINDLLSYDEIIITGGEPILLYVMLANFLHYLRGKYKKPIFLYSALYNDEREYINILRVVNGLHFTLHNEAKDKEIVELKKLSSLLLRYKDIYKHLSLRLAIDNRLYDKYDFSNIDFSGWSVVKKMKWLVNAPLPKDEELFIFDLENWYKEYTKERLTINDTTRNI